MATLYSQKDRKCQKMSQSLTLSRCTCHSQLDCIDKPPPRLPQKASQEFQLGSVACLHLLRCLQCKPDEVESIQNMNISEDLLHSPGLAICILSYCDQMPHITYALVVWEHCMQVFLNSLGIIQFNEVTNQSNGNAAHTTVEKHVKRKVTMLQRGRPRGTVLTRRIPGHQCTFKYSQTRKRSWSSFK